MYGYANGNGGPIDYLFKYGSKSLKFVNDQPATIQLVLMFAGPIVAEYKALQSVATLNSGAKGGSWLNSGKTFTEYKLSRGGTETLAKISTSTGTQRISTEFHHVLLTQRMQKAYNLPNWLVNNRVNVWKLNTIQHSMIDSYRFNFLRKGIKSDVGWFGKYNWFTKF